MTLFTACRQNMALEVVKGIVVLLHITLPNADIKSPVRATWARRMALISVSLAHSPTPSYVPWD